MQFHSIEELIDSGDEKFKLGLAWYLIYREIFDGNDYAYSSMLKEDSAEEIKKKLDKVYVKFLLQGDLNKQDLGCSMTYDDITMILKHARRKGYFGRFGFRDNGYAQYNSISEDIGNYMYTCLADPNTYLKKNRKVSDIVDHAANRVIRNYHDAKLLKRDTSMDCMKYISSYYALKEFDRESSW